MAREGRIATADVVEMTVGDVMMARPKTLPGDVLVAEVRRAFELGSVRTVLLADDGVFIGAIVRDAPRPVVLEPEFGRVLRAVAGNPASRPRLLVSGRAGFP